MLKIMLSAFQFWLCDVVPALMQIESIETDPYNVLGNVRARTANELLHAFGYIASHESELELPIYAHHGTKDRLANLGVSRRVGSTSLHHPMCMLICY